MGDFRRWCITAVLILSLVLSMEQPLQAVTVSQENQISREFMKQVFGQYEVVEDSEISDYIQGLGDKILATYPSQPFSFRFYVVKNNLYNAFAGPGAQIFIHSGLLAVFDNEDELAGTISHEIGHAVCRHISQNIDRSGKIGLGTLAGVAAGIFLGIYGDAAAGSALTVGSIAGSQSVALSYSRDDEMQADKLGLEHLMSAGYSGQGMVDALAKIRGQEWYSKDQIPTYMTTHPALEDRITYLENLMDTIPPTRKNTKPSDSTTFFFIREKLIALFSPIDEGKTRCQSILKKDPDNVYALYGMGVLLAREGRNDAAVPYLKKALEKKAFNTNILKMLGKVYFDSGKYDNARSVFEGALGLYPQDYESNLFMGRIYLESGQVDRALELLSPFVSDDRGETNAFYYLSDIYTRKGRLLESHYYLGMYYKQKRDGRNALIQFERALKIAQQPDMKKKIQKNIDDLKGIEDKGNTADQPVGKGLRQLSRSRQ
jgi:predicted Zn-dependent protease